jgi:DNA-binding MarR family transcriptional regulator
MHDEVLEQIAVSFVELRRVIFSRIMSKLDIDLPPAQSELLMNVANGPIKVKDIASVLHISSGAVTQLLDALSTQDLIERFTSEEDLRVVWVQLTDAGKRRLAKLRKQYVRHLTEMLEDLSDHEIEALGTLMDKIVNVYRPEITAHS